MPTIYSFLQKRKMHENQHGFIMVFIAYVMSALMLALGSDVFYNINSMAAGTSIKTEEEAKELYRPILPDLKFEDHTGQIYETNLVNPYGLSDTETNVKDEAASKSTSSVGSTMWLLGSAMDAETFDTLMEQMGSMDLMDNTTPKTAKKEVKSKTSSLAVEETVSTEYNISKKEVKMLERIVEAEASGEDMVGKILIANVIFNRIKDDSFPDTIEDVIFQNTNGDYQFSPIKDERFWSVDVSKETKKAVQRALKGEDYSKGALYFVARKRTNKSSAQWFDHRLDRLFKHGGHEFYKNK